MKLSDTTAPVEYEANVPARLRYVIFIMLLIAGLGVTVYGIVDTHLAEIQYSLKDEISYLTFFAILALPGIVSQRYFRAGILAVAGFGLAMAGISAVAILVAILLASTAIGAMLFARVHVDSKSVFDDVLAATLGLVVLAVALACTGALSIHAPHIYLLMVVAACAAGRHHLRSVTHRAVHAFDDWQVPESRAERVLVFTLTVSLMLHWILGLKPEAGFDALAMHLAIPVQVSLNHHWDYDVTRYAWAVMPISADWIYTFAYVLGGETPMRLINVLAFFGVMVFTYRLIRAEYSRWTALAAMCLLTSTPFLYLESTTNFIEHFQTLALIAGVTAYFRWRARPEAAIGWLYMAAALLGGAMTFKVMSGFTVVVVGGWLIVDCYRGRFPGWRHIVGVSIVAFLMACPPYVGAWWITGNPVFPFFNNIFKSPFYDSSQAFTNPLYSQRLPWDVLYRLTFDTPRFLEVSQPGAFGIYLLALFPAAIALLRRRSSALMWFSLCIFVFVFVMTFRSQAYIRYLYIPCLFATIMVAGGLDTIRSWTRGTSSIWTGCLTCLMMGITAFQIFLIPTTSQLNTTLCLGCAISANARHAFMEQNAPDRIVAGYINARYAAPRVGLMTTNRPLGATIEGYVRSDSWHDVESAKLFSTTYSGDEIAAWAKRFNLTLFVFPATESERTVREATRRFRMQYTRTIFSAGDLDLAIWREDTPVLAEFSGDLTGWIGAGERTPVARDGSVRVTVKDNVYKIVPVVAGTHYRSTITVRCDGENNVARLQTTWFDAENRTIDATLHTKPCNSALREFEAGSVAPPHATSAIVYITGHTDRPVYVSRMTFGSY